MNKNKERRAFAKSRVLPAFGILLKWLIEILQLRDVSTYNLGREGLKNRKQLEKALNEFSSRTSDDVFAGLIVNEGTKRRMSMALAACLWELPTLPFNSLPLEKFAEWILHYWQEYERASGLLSSLSEYRDLATRPLFRHAAIEMAIRAGALAYLCGEVSIQENQPVWSQDEQLRRHLRAWAKSIGTREGCAEKLGESKSEIGRWLDDLDVPPASAIQLWESLLEGSDGLTVDSGARPLWRLFIGRRIWNSIRETIPGELWGDMLNAYCRIKERVRTFLCLEHKIAPEKKREIAILLLLQGRITDPLLGAQVMKGESDVIWRRHIEAVLRIENAPTAAIVRLCQTWVAIYSIYQDPRCVRKPDSFEEFIRTYYSKAECGGNPSAEYARLLEELGRSESKGDYDRAATEAVQLVALAPFSAGAWHALGRIRRFQKNREATELCFRTAVELDPSALEVRADLAVQLVFGQKIEEARELLNCCAVAQKRLVEWRFANAMVLLSSRPPEEALREFLKCAEEGFVPSVCYQFAAMAADVLGLAKEAREYRKRALELGASVGGRRAVGAQAK